MLIVALGSLEAPASGVPKMPPAGHREGHGLVWAPERGGLLGLLGRVPRVKGKPQLWPEERFLGFFYKYLRRV